MGLQYHTHPPPGLGTLQDFQLPSGEVTIPHTHEHNYLTKTCFVSMSHARRNGLGTKRGKEMSHVTTYEHRSVVYVLVAHWACRTTSPIRANYLDIYTRRASLPTSRTTAVTRQPAVWMKAAAKIKPGIESTFYLTEVPTKFHFGE